mgnify:CR=1 FL=1
MKIKKILIEEIKKEIERLKENDKKPSGTYEVQQVILISGEEMIYSRRYKIFKITENTGRLKDGRIVYKINGRWYCLE